MILTCDTVKMDDSVNVKGKLSFAQYSYHSSNIHEDGIQYILCGGIISEVIDSIRQRIKYLKREGVEII